jgi:hypothetical protein
MSTLAIVLLSVGIPIGYGLAAGITWAVLAPIEADFGEGRILGTIFWPLALPFALGAAIVARLQRPSLPTATARPAVKP